MRVEDVAAAVLSQYGMPVERLRGTTRHPRVCDARGMICKIASERFGSTGRETARVTHASGSHTSAITARRRFDRRLREGADTEPVGREPVPLSQVYGDVLGGLGMR